MATVEPLITHAPWECSKVMGYEEVWVLQESGV